MSRFSPSEIALLNHRLEIWDAITEVLADDDDEGIASIAVNDPAMVHFVTLQLMGMMEQGRPVEEVAEIANTAPLWGAVLRDAVEGNTYVCNIPSDMPEAAPQRRAAVRAANSVVAKLHAAGFTCGDVPNY